MPKHTTALLVSLLAVLASCQDVSPEKRAEYERACRMSRQCPEMGACAWRGRLAGDRLDVVVDCRPTDDEMCERAEVCKMSGACALGKYGMCAPTSDEHCAASTSCRTGGSCALTDLEMCAPSKPEHCANSDGCKALGKFCAYADGRCVD